MASRFWVGGTGTWDAATTTHWSDSSGGSGGFSVPGSGDSVTFDASSGGGTVTLNFGGTITITTLSMGTFTGTFDNSVNNNNITMTAAGTAFSISGTGTRNIKLGTATYTLSANGATFSAASISNLTLAATSSTISFTGNGARSFNISTSATSWGTVSFAAAVSSGNPITFVGNPTIATLNIAGPNMAVFPNSGTTTITTLNANGTSSAQVLLQGQDRGSATLAVGGGGTWCGLWGLTCSGSPSFTNSFDFGSNSGVTISSPSAGGGGGGILGC